MQSFIKNHSNWLKSILILGLYVLFMGTAYASGGGSSGLPWEDPLNKVVQSLTGPVALGISILGMFGAGAGLIFGSELEGIVKKMVILVLVISILVFAASFMTQVFGISGALI